MQQQRSISQLIKISLAVAVVCGLSYRQSLADDPQKCNECHEEEVASYKNGLHSKAFASTGRTENCSSCHGPGDTHSTDKSLETIIGFTKVAGRTTEEKNKQCLSCHATSKELAFWNQGVHNRNDVSCASCHTMHNGVASTKPTINACFTCHKDVKFQANKVSHHPIIEGKVACWDCHNPHGSMSHGNLKTDNVNQLCYKCHAEKRGPFLYGHPPVEENCANCHKPHGSQHAKLLVEKVNSLCQNCHSGSQHVGTPYDGRTGFKGASTGTWAASPRAFGRSCMNCHSNIHGSNTASARGSRFAR